MPLTLLLVILAADVAVFALAPPQFLYPDQPPTVQRAEAAAVLFHDFTDRYQGIDSESRRRVNHAVLLYQQGRVGHLIMAGGSRPQHGASGARLMTRYAAGRGIPAERIITDHDSLDTRGNLTSIAGVVKARDWHSLMLVSSPYHLLRLTRLAEFDLPARVSLSPYDPLSCSPPLTRYETWRTVHYNLVAYLLHRLLPEPWYGRFVTWVRTHTTL